ncbi:MAG: DNA alkylation repair protein [Pseudomonadota bacterium]
MAELLKNQFGSNIPKVIAEMLRAVDSSFPAKAFVKDSLDGYDALELMPRGRHIAKALHKHLPSNYEQAITLLMTSISQPHTHGANMGMTSFMFMPHMFFIRDFGLDNFEASMQAQYVLTQRFTAEFSIRPFIERYPQETLQRLKLWTQDPSHHVRRLVSEGTRPRLPWAGRLREFQKNPQPVLGLLELLKDDPELYVRRSVANNLNDIGKDNPEQLFATAQRWLHDASHERRWLVQHALRSSIKRGEPGALNVMGVGNAAQVELSDITVTPARARSGESVVISFVVTNTAADAQRVLVDFQIHYVKASGQSKPKVFKLKTIDLAKGQSLTLGKKVTLAELTTRKHYAGVHVVEALINGRVMPLGSFQLLM